MILVMNYSSIYKSKKFAERYELKMRMILGELNKKNKRMLMQLHLQNLEMMLVIRVFGELHFI
ncbi:MAG: hypothetical protein CM1200mP33_5110 [Chloroflexota bacterium]|nr:MAG: hypothetical protein CM1200mP33_5110 [Chloroflexota bacterium]